MSEKSKGSLDFHKYNSIENSYRQKFLDKIVEEGHSGQVYVVEEKIHGSNFSFWVNHEKILCGKRSGFVDKSENFNNSEAVLKKYYFNLKALHGILALSQGAQTVALFGEIYGGNYPHKDVPPVNQAVKVQKGVYYRPDNDFVCFDIAVDGNYISVDEVQSLCAKCGIPFSASLFRGSLEDCLKYPNAYPTLVPKMLGLPEIHDNICEGNVIRPVIPTFLWSGERLILKNKNERFAEKQKEPKKLKDTPKALDNEAQAIVDNMAGYITENRLRNVISKIGAVSKEDFGKLMGLFSQDIIEDFQKDNDNVLNTLEKDARHRINKLMGQQAALLIRKNFLNITDNNF